MNTLNLNSDELYFLSPYLIPQLKHNKIKTNESSFHLKQNIENLYIEFKEEERRKEIVISLEDKSLDENSRYTYQNHCLSQEVKSPYFVFGDKKSILEFKADKKLIISSHFIKKIMNKFNELNIDYQEINEHTIVLNTNDLEDYKKTIESVTNKYTLKLTDGSIEDEMLIHKEDYFILNNVLFLKSPGKIKNKNNETFKYSYNLSTTSQNNKLLNIEYTLFYI